MESLRQKMIDFVIMSHDVAIEIRLFAFIAGGGGGRGKQFSTPLGDHVRVNQPSLVGRGIDE